MNGQRGFTLVEVLLAMLVFMAGVAGLYALLSTGLSMQKDGLETARVDRHVAAVLQAAERRLAEDDAWDGELGRWRDLPPAALPDGTWYRVTFLPAASPAGAGRAELRVATSEEGLERARPLECVLDPGRDVARAVAAWRARRATTTLEDP